MTKEEIRLVECQQREKHWKRWGPYLSERAWGLGRLIFQKGFGEENSGAVNPHDRQRRSLLSISARRRSNCAVSATSLFVITCPNEPNSTSTDRSFFLFLPTITTASARFSSRSLPTAFPIPLDPPIIKPVLPANSGRTFPSGLLSLECMEISLLTGCQI